MWRTFAKLSTKATVRFVAIIILLLSTLFVTSLNIYVADATVTVSNIYPPDNSVTLDATPDFRCTPTSNVSTTVNITLYVDGVASGTIFNHPNNTEATITCNWTLSESDVKKPWYFAITDADGTYNTETRHIGIGAYFKAPATLLNPNATSEHWTYRLNASTSNLNVGNAITILDKNITLDGQNYTLDGNDVADNGIYFHSSGTTNVTIKNIVVTDWDTTAIDCNGVNYNTFENIVIDSCPDYGLILWDCDNNILNNITVTNCQNQDALKLTLSLNNIISNVILANNHAGLTLDDADHTIITNATILNNIVGLHFFSSYNNTITNSRVQDNTNAGVWMDQCENTTRNIFYNNIFNNTNNLSWYQTPYTHNWNTTRQLGTRIYSNGTYIGGNFWAKPDGTGPSEVGEDADGDGFLDAPVQIGGYNNYDYLAYSLSCGEILKIRPVDSKGKNLLNALVIINNGTEHSMYVVDGWANWTGQTYGNTVSISVTFQDIRVNTTMLPMNGLYGVVALQCDVYSLTIMLVDVVGDPVPNVPLLLYRNGTLINGMYGLPDDPKTNASGMFTWTQLAYQPASYTIVVPGATSQTVPLTEDTTITLTMPPPSRPRPSPKPAPTPPQSLIELIIAWCDEHKRTIIIFATLIIAIIYLIKKNK